MMPRQGNGANRNETTLRPLYAAIVAVALANATPASGGPFKLYEKDKAGVILHDVLFAPFSAGAAGTGYCWHWDKYIDKNGLWLGRRVERRGTCGRFDRAATIQAVNCGEDCPVTEMECRANVSVGRRPCGRGGSANGGIGGVHAAKLVAGALPAHLIPTNP